MNISTDKFANAKTAMSAIVDSIVEKGELPRHIVERAALIGITYMSVGDSELHALVDATERARMSQQHPVSRYAQPGGIDWIMGCLTAIADGYGSVPGVGPEYAAKYALAEMVAVNDDGSLQIAWFQQLFESFLVSRGVSRPASN